MDKYRKYNYISCETMYEFSEGMAAVKKKGKYGFIDKTGEIVIPCEYDYASVLKEGMASVELNGKYGYIDKNNNLLVPYMYGEAFDFKEGLAAVAIDDKYGFINKQGDLVIDILYDDIACEGFSEGFVSVAKDEKFGFINKEGKEISRFNYDDEAYFHEGLAAVVRNGKFGFINTLGEEVIPLIYHRVAANGFYNGKTFVKKDSDGEWEIINKDGERIKTVPYKASYPFLKEGLAVVSDANGLSGCIDIDGNVIIPFEYEHIQDSSEGLLLARKGGSYGFIDHKNKVVIPFSYIRGSDFYDGLADVSVNRFKGLMIDQRNDIVFGVKKEVNLTKLIVRLIIILGIIGFIIYKMFIA